MYYFWYRDILFIELSDIDFFYLDEKVLDEQSGQYKYVFRKSEIYIEQSQYIDKFFTAGNNQLDEGTKCITFPNIFHNHNLSPTKTIHSNLLLRDSLRGAEDISVSLKLIKRNLYATYSGERYLISSTRGMHEVINYVERLLDNRRKMIIAEMGKLCSSHDIGNMIADYSCWLSGKIKKSRSMKFHGDKYHQYKLCIVNPCGETQFPICFIQFIKIADFPK